jgi:hypothetical protein
MNCILWFGLLKITLKSLKVTMLIFLNSTMTFTSSINLYHLLTGKNILFFIRLGLGYKVMRNDANKF